MKPATHLLSGVNVNISISSPTVKGKEDGIREAKFHVFLTSQGGRLYSHTTWPLNPQTGYEYNRPEYCILLNNR
jgi:hypothetical protein